MIVALIAVGAGCGHTELSSAPASATPVQPTTTAPTTTTVEPDPVVTVGCDDVSYEIATTNPDFAAVWTSKQSFCEGARTDGPLSSIERRAVDVAGYDDSDVVYLYDMCAVVDTEDTYQSADHSANAKQAREIRGVLTLCPDHPHAKRMKAVIARGSEEARLKAAGKTFFAGTFRVGKDIQPGTYIITGEIENCYWERQDNAGQAIDNAFITAARRVEVTIQPGDYAFSSEGCGQWKPA